MKRTNILIFTVLSLLHFSLRAQFYDDFSDGDFTRNPTWSGDSAQFVVNAQQMLQLNAQDAGTAYLSIPYLATGNEIEWEFDIKLAFAPSGGNFARIFVAADNPTLTNGNLSGYYLQFGEAGNSDVVELIYQNEMGCDTIIKGITSIASSFYLRVKLHIGANNQWHLWIDPLRNGIYTNEGSGFGRFPPDPQQFFGILCQFTSGNRNKFQFDNIYVGGPQIDSIPPSLVEIVCAPDSARQLLARFSEPLHETSALECTHYTIAETGLHPALCEFSDANQQSVRLFFAENFSERTAYHIIIENVSDLSQNPIPHTECPFWLYRLRRNEMIITEIMAAPTPSVGLPEYEYIELHNTLGFPVNINGWKLGIGSSIRLLPDLRIESSGYAIISSPTGCEQFQTYGSTFSIGSFSITDDGQPITLYDENDNVIFHVSFKRKWHRNKLKQSGGWSLEMMDPNNPCTGSDNWDSSVAPIGGTPGQRNSITTDNRDWQSPEIEKITVLDSLHILIFFSEPLKENHNLTIYQIDHDITVLEASPLPPDFSKMELRLSKPLRPHTIYELQIGDSLCDCAGNTVRSGSYAHFGMAVKPNRKNLIINEILSNPYFDTDGDYVELYNPSEEIVDLGDVWLGTGKGEVPDNVSPAVATGFLLFPHCYAAICKDKALTQLQYLPPDNAILIENENLPAFPNDEGGVHILDAEFHVIDRLYYDKSLHYPLLTSTDGVSFERLHPDIETQNASNWTSASESTHWGTPGYSNSQASSENSGEEIVHFSPEIISPDGDGYNDYLEIFCTFPEESHRITIQIYDYNGRLIKQLANNQVSGVEEYFRWDGTTDDHRSANEGFYIVKVLLWNLSGKKQTIRKSIGLTRRL